MRFPVEAEMTFEFFGKGREERENSCKLNYNNYICIVIV